MAAHLDDRVCAPLEAKELAAIACLGLGKGLGLGLGLGLRLGLGLGLGLPPSPSPPSPSVSSQKPQSPVTHARPRGVGMKEEESSPGK